MILGVFLWQWLLNEMQVIFAFLVKKIIVKVVKIYYKKAGALDDFFVYVVWSLGGDYFS